jgi:polysaccharide export outer membrane protein
LAAALTALAVLAGCGPNHEHTDTDLAAFERAGPVRFNADYKQTLRRRRSAGPYRVVPGDLLALQMPGVVRLLPDREGDETTPYRSRVDSAGRIVLPIVGALKVSGKTLAEIERAVVEAYHPKYVRREPSVVATVSDYRVATVSVVGAVEDPGVYVLRSNEMTVISALMKAGGIAERGAASLHVSGASGKSSRTIPVLDLNIPSEDVALADGDTVVVEEMANQGVSVVGLVKKPGLFPWNAKRRCTVMDALAFAGGVNDLADPQYARVYRQDADGKIVTALLKLHGPCAGGAGELLLKPGDIVVVEQTPRTRTRLILSQIVRMGLGVNAGASVGP